MVAGFPIGGSAIAQVSLLFNGVTLETTVERPTLVATMNEWVLNTTVNQPTIEAVLISGEVYTLNTTVRQPTITPSVISGQLFSLNKEVKRPSLTAQIFGDNYITLSKGIPQPTFRVLIAVDSIYVLSSTVRKPTLKAFWLNDILNATATTYVMNTLNVGHSTYSNYGFNSYMRIANEYYGINSAGVWHLTGDLDNTTAITSEVHLPVSSYDKQGLKACTDAILLGRLEGDVEFKIVMDEQEEREGFVVAADDRPGLHRIRVKVHKGLKGAVVQPKLKNLDGCQFAVNNLELFLRELARIR